MSAAWHHIMAMNAPLHALVLALLVNAPHQVVGTAATTWRVDPMTVKIMSDRRATFASSSTGIDMAAQRGECERQQLWGWNDSAALMDVRLEFADAHSRVDGGGGVLPRSIWSWKQQGYVNATATHSTTSATRII